MKYTSLLCILGLFLLAVTCKKSKLESELLQKTWLHSYEEDQGDIMTFRPNTFDFPPSRGRTGFTMEKDGIIRQYEIAPADGLEEVTGHWELEGQDTILVKFDREEQSPEQDYRIKILSLKDQVLKIRRLPLQN
ncbi:hypothetical protein [Pontibacter sp. SGAir0037]|uniref:hypothetical protein n=1 Tax=Pontibacter sp. SGAir0037 TaxID=2571030 RepID=UPI0010CD4BEA|nr:hypothetical protein [Pontibacter sp. SGAir0037]QCR25202.1 hypothetical protein C1N53_20815 [Pontibacter sp. SGAir0037]